ncbi:MAG: hypothetical protein IMW89_09595 [Ktedonobacteraceae bacterium]|nr:hypothetical protein [Ktedonobacteraceae bacterium]
MPQQPADDHVDIVQENPTGSPDAPAIVLAESQESQEASIADPQSSRTFRQFSSIWSAVLLLLILSFVMVMIYLLLFPLMGDPALINDSVQSALPGLFPWLAEISWTTALPQVVAQVARIPWLNPLQPGAGRANLQMLLLVLACVCMLLAAWVGNRVARLRISRGHARVLFWVVLLSTVTFGATLLLAPVRLDAMSRDMLVSGLYGRMMVVYHVNPYVVSPAIFQHDMLYSAFLHVPTTLSLPSTAIAGPVWMDLSLLVALLARDSTANILLGFRLVGLVAHLVSATLVWSLLGELKPEMRLASMIFYAWNPLILLFGVFAVHLEIVVILFLLLAFVFFQRDALVLSWVFALLAVLVNVLCLPLLLLIGHMSMKKARLLRARRHAYWWLVAVLVSAVVVLLAYLPYWQQAGSVVFTAGLFQAFWPDHVTNSLAEALINLPVQLPAVVVWLVDPHHWTLCALVIIALFFLLFPGWPIRWIPCWYVEAGCSCCC